MITYLFENPFVFLIGLIGLVIAISIHEFSHAYVADRLGDPTPRLMGRVTLNPLAHLDPIGTIAILLVGFGWGKPVQFDPFNLANPRRDAALISFAGPLSNILLALILAILARVFPSPYTFVLPSLIYINCMLALFNLIPVHPLDGFKIVSGLLSQEQAEKWQELERYGPILLIALLLPLIGGTSLVSVVLSPVLDFVLGLLLG